MNERGFAKSDARKFDEASCLPFCLPFCFSASLFASLPFCLPVYMPACFSTACLPAGLPACLPASQKLWRNANSRSLGPPASSCSPWKTLMYLLKKLCLSKKNICWQLFQEEKVIQACSIVLAVCQHGLDNNSNKK